MAAVPIVLEGVRPACPHLAPILCAELPVSAAQLTTVLDGPTAHDVFRFHLFADFLFLVFYGTFFAAPFARERRGTLPAVLVFLGAVADVVENVSLLRALDGVRTEALATWIRTAAQTKFFLIALGVSAGCLVLAGRARGPARWVYVFLAVFSAIGMAGPVVPIAHDLALLSLVAASLALLVRAGRRAFGETGEPKRTSRTRSPAVP